jgi:peptidoglycan/LPS O-acetylase OafA/YrhL
VNRLKRPTAVSPASAIIPRQPLSNSDIQHDQAIRLYLKINCRSIKFSRVLFSAPFCAAKTIPKPLTKGPQLSYGEPVSHKNNFGLLRLLFAMLVIVSHSFELIDGNRTREPLTVLFGTLSIAEIAVAGFFLVSGYLIAQSYEASSSLLSYLVKRVLRIYPAFVVASLFCILVVGPLSGADLAALSLFDWAKTLARTIALQVPKLPGAFAGQPYPSLNGSMWTIAYEFRCYLVLPLLGFAGLMKSRVLLSLTLAFWIGVAATQDSSTVLLGGALGNPHETFRLTGYFLAGVCFYLYRDSIVYRSEIALAAAACLLAALLNKYTAGISVAIFGGYLIFWFAFLPGTPRLNAVNSRTDISYGIYVYAWPVQMLLIRYVPGISPTSVMALTLAIASFIAYLSWKFIEHPALSAKASLDGNYLSHPDLGLLRKRRGKYRIETM